jgi:hypothetical protein
MKFDWSRVTLLSGGALRCGQEFFGGELLYVDDKMTWLPTWQHFLEGEFSGG